MKLILISWYNFAWSPVDVAIQQHSDHYVVWLLCVCRARHSRQRHSTGRAGFRCVGRWSDEPYQSITGIPYSSHKMYEKRHIDAFNYSRNDVSHNYYPLNFSSAPVMLDFGRTAVNNCLPSNATATPGVDNTATGSTSTDNSNTSPFHPLQLLGENDASLVLQPPGELASNTVPGPLIPQNGIWRGVKSCQLHLLRQFTSIPFLFV